MKRRGHALRRRYGRAFRGTHAELRSMLSTRARRMSYREFSNSLSPDEYRAITFFFGSTPEFYKESTQ